MTILQRQNVDDIILQKDIAQIILFKNLCWRMFTYRYYKRS